MDWETSPHYVEACLRPLRGPATSTQLLVSGTESEQEDEDEDYPDWYFSLEFREDFALDMDVSEDHWDTPGE